MAGLIELHRLRRQIRPRPDYVAWSKQSVMRISVAVLLLSVLTWWFA